MAQILLEFSIGIKLDKLTFQSTHLILLKENPLRSTQYVEAFNAYFGESQSVHFLRNGELMLVLQIGQRKVWMTPTQKCDLKENADQTM